MDPRSFVGIAMRYSFKRRMSEMCDPGSSAIAGGSSSSYLSSGSSVSTEWSKGKVLRIDKSPDRYMRPLATRLAERAVREEEERRRLSSERLANPHVYALRLQRWWRRSERLRVVVNNTEEDSPGSGGYLRCRGRDVICPITQERIPWRMAFRFVTDDGAVIAYSAPHLVSYLLSSGKFSCCLTRAKIRRPVVLRLQRRALQLGVDNAASLMCVYGQRRAILNNRIENDNAILAIEVSCGELMVEALDLCSDLSLTTADVGRSLQLDVLPNWRALVRNYMGLDEDACRGMLMADQQKLYRLISSTEADAHGMMAVIQDNVEEALTRCNAYEIRDTGRPRGYDSRHRAHRTSPVPLNTPPTRLHPVLFDSGRGQDGDGGGDVFDVFTRFLMTRGSIPAADLGFFPIIGGGSSSGDSSSNSSGGPPPLPPAGDLRDDA